MDIGERERFVAALHKAKSALNQAKEHVLGTGQYANYFPVYKEAMAEIEACNIGSHKSDLQRLRDILSEMRIAHDEERIADPTVEYVIEVEDTKILFDEVGKYIAEDKSP